MLDAVLEREEYGSLGNTVERCLGGSGFRAVLINSRSLPYAVINVDIGQVFIGVRLVFCLQIANAKGILKNFLIEPFVPHKQVSIPNKALRSAFKSLLTCTQLRWIDIMEKAEVWECAVKLRVSMHCGHSCVQAQHWSMWWAVNNHVGCCYSTGERLQITWEGPSWLVKAVHCCLSLVLLSVDNTLLMWDTSVCAGEIFILHHGLQETKDTGYFKRAQGRTLVCASVV